MNPHSELYLQGYLNAEKLAPGDVVDGVVGRVEILEKTLRPRSDMAPLVILRAEDGQGLRFEPGFPVAVYGPEKVWLDPGGGNPWQRAQEALRATT